jgi:hypothetical protein
MNRVYNEKIVPKKKTKYNSYSIGLSVFFFIFYLILIIFAIHLSLKCNGGFDFPSMMVAVFFPWIYIIYYLIAKNNKCALRRCQAGVDVCRG